MPTVLLIRHGRTDANVRGILAGRSPGVPLDDHGLAQAAELSERLADLPLRLLVSSPLERTMSTAQALTGHEGGGIARPAVTPDARLLECDYGDWTNRPLAELTTEPMWRTVQAHPSAAVFPNGESLAAVQSRAVAAIRDLDRQVATEVGPNAIWAAVSHGDVIKAVLADALGMHLDSFQRIVVDPCSVSVVQYTELRPFVLVSNGNGAGLRRLAAAPDSEQPSVDATVGGGAG